MNKVWLAFANTSKFDAINCFRDLGRSYWKMGTRKFAVDDIIYFYVSSERKVMFKTKIATINLRNREWADDSYWSEKERKKSVGKKRMELILIDEYNGEKLDDDVLRYYGMPEKKSSLQQPVYNSLTDCIDYIRRVF